VAPLKRGIYLLTTKWSNIYRKEHPTKQFPLTIGERVRERGRF